MAGPKSSLCGVATLASIALAPAVLAISGEPVPGVDVSLERKPGRLIRQVRTDTQGNFNFGFVQQGDYVITVRPGAASSPSLGSGANPAPSGSVATGYIESRSGSVGAAPGSPLRLQVTVNGAGSGSATRSVHADRAQQIPVSTSGGQLGGRIVAQ